ncbi:hypothetical protein [Amycolatopsis pithecellobii]|uniref:hypothetical protein n=1 Tax=Amycolatopsis pithecellobii TaxID=664692 RepID=UPI00140994A3|nr:hypothetical protein [Amycolatopsis pithecellobii]
MGFSPPAYVRPQGAKALQRRLTALLSAGFPVPCGVYAGLADPGPRSPRHAVVTHRVATELADRTAERVPRTNTNPAPILRVLAAASWGRADAMGSDLSAFPVDLASPLWRDVADLAAEPAELTVPERRVAADLLLRLGYVRHASSVLGLDGVTASAHAFSTPELAIKEFAVLYWRPHDSSELDSLALRGAADPALPAETRVSLATFAVVRQGKLGVRNAVMDEAARLAQDAADELSGSFADSLARQAFYRGLAFVPFVQRDRAGTLELLDKAYRCQMDAVPTTVLEKLAWDDYAFPLFETLAKTNTVLERPEKAVAATDTLLAISPHDHRAWAARGRALLAAGDLDAALAAYTHMESLGGLATASAAFHRGWVLHRLGRRDDAQRAYRISREIDPTVTAVTEQLEHLGRPVGV